MRYLILIDKKFPFDAGEPFLENEIGMYSEKVDKIIVIPIDIGTDSRRTRDVPCEVDVIKTTNAKRKIYQISLGLRSISGLFSRQSISTITVNKYNINLKNMWFAQYYNHLCNDKIKFINSILNNYDIRSDDEVVLYSYWLYTTATIAVGVREALEKKGIRARVISRAHRFDIYQNSQPFKHETIEALDLLFPCSDNGTQYLKQRYLEFKDKIHTGYLGTINHGIMHYDRVENTFIIVSCSRVTSIKRVDKIAEALRYIDDNNMLNGYKIHWTHIGDGPCMEVLKKACKKNFTNVSVKLCGAIQNQEVYEYYNTHYADLFINVSSSEGLPVSIMEAISYGMPVIATDVGGSSEIVIDRYNGLILNKDFSISDLANNILFFVGLSKEKYMRYRENSRTLWAEKYNAEINYPGFIDKIF